MHSASQKMTFKEDRCLQEMVTIEQEGGWLLTVPEFSQRRVQMTVLGSDTISLTHSMARRFQMADLKLNSGNILSRMCPDISKLITQS